MTDIVWLNQEILTPLDIVNLLNLIHFIKLNCLFATMVKCIKPLIVLQQIYSVNINTTAVELIRSIMATALLSLLFGYII